jgi:hypothetical protein
MPYDGHHGGNGWNNHGGHGWDHGHGHFHNHWGFYGYYGWVGYPLWPWWGWGYWGYPYLYNDWSYWNGYDSQPANDSAQPYTQPYPEYTPGPYDAPPDQDEPQEPSPTPQPDSHPAPTANSAPPAAGAPVTVVFKDGRPNEQIHNYLLTARTLSVLDQNHREIPVDQIDLAATARLNHQAGVEFSVPTVSR